jgi:hypothetical protein
MKKFVTLTLAAALLLTLFAGCGKVKAPAPETTPAVPETTAPVVPETEAPETEAPETEAAAPQSEMAALISTIYANHGPLELMVDTFPNEFLPLETVMESITYYTGLADDSKVAEVAISEPMMGQAYSLVLVKVADGADAAEVAKEMFDNIDQRKWICVEADTKTAACTENVAFLFMVNSDFAEQVSTESMLEAFKAAVGTDVTVIG